jgi:hypothetical protein
MVVGSATVIILRSAFLGDPRMHKPYSAARTRLPIGTMRDILISHTCVLSR